MLSGHFFTGRAAAERCGGACAILLSLVSAQAWGPHETITQAALNALGTNDALVVLLGPQAQRLTNYAWMGDYFGVVVEEPDTLFFADDYLLFPAMPRYVDHTGPEVRDAFQPFFKRALQALRTENRANAARWVGALLHFVQDAGCPPHAAGLRGDVHSKMEDWVEADRIRLPDHAPVSLGADDAQALQALQRRLNELFPEAQERGRRLRVPVEIGNRSAVRDPMLQSALACARLTADLLHTLGQISPKGLAGSATLRGTVWSWPPVGMERFPAKVILTGTAFSTLADLSGKYEFRHLPAGNFTVMAFRSGNGPTQTNVNLKTGETRLCDFALPKEPANLVLNGDFKLSSIRPNAPDYWYQTKTGWEGEPVLLRDGQRYRLTANVKEDARNLVLVRWLRRPDRAVPRFKIEPRFDTRTLTATNREVIFTGSPDKGLLHVTIRGRGRPDAVCEGISLVPLPPENARTP
jgi:hypothetical protein